LIVALLFRHRQICRDQIEKTLSYKCNALLIIISIVIIIIIIIIKNDERMPSSGSHGIVLMDIMANGKYQ
jgi:hypothetical protein